MSKFVIKGLEPLFSHCLCRYATLTLTLTHCPFIMAPLNPTSLMADLDTSEESHIISKYANEI